MLRTAALISVVAIALLPVRGRAEDGGSAQSSWDAMVKCAVYRDDLRHACTDEVLRDAGVLPRESPARSRESSGLQSPKPAVAPVTGDVAAVSTPPTPAAREVPAALAAATAKGSVPASESAPSNGGSVADQRESFGLQPKPDAPAVAAKKLKRVEVTLASVDQALDGKLLLTTTEGAVWRQTESETLHPPPEQGQSMKIDTAHFGGFICRVGSGTSFRCYRTR